MLDLNKLEMQLDKSLLEDDLEEWILNKRKKNNLMVQINKWYWNPEKDYYPLHVNGKCPGFHPTIAGYEWDSYMLTNGELTSGVQIGSWQEADMEKVKSLLILEAEKRFPKGVKFWPFLGSEIDKSVIPEISDGRYSVHNSGLYVAVYICDVFKEGKWAEVVSPEELLNPPINPLWLLDEDNYIRPFNQLNEEVPLRENIMFFRTEREAKDVAYARELKKVTDELKKEYGIE